MHRTKGLACGVMALCCLLLTGCDKLKELTAEEEEIIALYSAKVVAKHNVRLGQGIMRYRGSEDEQDAEEEEAAEDEALDEDGEDASPRADSSGSDSVADAEDEAEDSTAEPMTLNQALGIEDVSFYFNGAYVPESLRLTSYYTLPDPPQGTVYVLASFDAVNESGNPAEVSIVSRSPRFTASLNGETASAEMLLDHDLMTYYDTLAAGGSEELLLLFNFSEETARDLSGLSLAISIDGEEHPLVLN